MAEQTSLDAIASLLKLFTGQTTKTSGGSVTETTGSGLDQTALAGLLRTALESNQGLAATTQGQRTAGLYNSSTNRLMSNDLLARLTANAAAAGATKTSTRTIAPQNVKVGGDNAALLGKLGMGLTAYQKLGGDKLVSMLGTGSSVGTSDLLKANIAGKFGSDPTAGLTDLISSQGWADTAANTFSGSALDVAGLGGDAFQTFAPEGWSDLADSAGSVADAVSNVDTSSLGDSTANFPTASATSSASLNSGNPSSSEILAEAKTADATTVAGSMAGNAGSGITGSLFSSSAPTAGFSAGDLGGGLTNTGSSAATLGYSSTDLGGGVSGSVGTGEAASSTGGSILGYIGPIMSAIGAQNNPNGAQNKDYRHAVGSAVLNYFGAGWASPIVHAVAEPALNASMEAGTKSLGTFGAVLADPVGAPLSGQYEIGDLVQSTLDPANIFGGNPGGSTGALVGATLDPVGAALGDKGAFSVIKDSINSIIPGAGGSGGKVICTELVMTDRLAPELYKKAISPELVMKGQMLLGYHIIGVRLVRLMRKYPALSDYLASYTADYIRHKAGDRNFKGFFVKSFLHPISWILGFFNTDPEYYKVLYPYRRNRKVKVA